MVPTPRCQEAASLQPNTPTAPTRSSTLVALPPIIASAVQKIRWPLGPSSCPPLYLLPLRKLAEIRSESKKQSGHREMTPIDTIVSNIPAVISVLAPDGVPDEQRHHSIIALSLLLLGHGFTDEAHALVSPLSWPDETPFGYGKNLGRDLYSLVSPSVLSIATYTHSLVHRREAFNAGEFGMVGFSNANYWTNAAIGSRGASTLPYREIREAVIGVAMGNDAAESWYRECQERAVDEDDEEEEYWESRALHELCGRVMRPKEDDSEAGSLKEFAELAAEAELRVLLRHALRHAGYYCPGVGIAR